MKIFQIDENLYQSSMIDDVERAKMFDVIYLAGGIDPDASDFKIYLKGMRGQEIVNHIRKTSKKIISHLVQISSMRRLDLWTYSGL